MSRVEDKPVTNEEANRMTVIAEADEESENRTSIAAKSSTMTSEAAKPPRVIEPTKTMIVTTT